MEGITIIEEHLCRNVEMPFLICTGFFITLLCIGALALYRWMYKNETKENKVMIKICSIGVIIIFIVFWAVQICAYNEIHFEYTIKVDDSVTFNDFFDRYEIVSVDGNRYRVKEIDNHIKE